MFLKKKINFVFKILFFSHSLIINAINNPNFGIIKILRQIDKSILNKNIDLKQKKELYTQLLNYVKPLAVSKITKIDFDLPLINPNYNERYKPTNPSIIKTHNGYLVICRTVNYSYLNTKYTLLAQSTKYNSCNFLLTYDKNFNLLRQQEIIDNSNIQRYKSKSLGIEDCRIFRWNNSYWFTCTSYDTNPMSIPQIALCKLSNDLTNNNVNVDNFILLKGPDQSISEKNWLPFILNNNLMLIHSYNPLLIISPNLENGLCKDQIIKKQDLDFTTLRGSAGPIEFDNGYLVLTHEMLRRYLNPVQRNDKKYFSRFLFFDKNFNLQKISRPFIFKHLGIEFCCSMTLDHSNQNLVITIGIDDNEAYFCVTDIETVRKILRPINFLKATN